MHDADLCSTPVTTLVTWLRDGELSARELLDAHLARIEAVNRQVNAVVSLDVDGARAAASAADDALAAGEPVGRLHGIPVAHKDTHATAGMRTTYGSPVHADLVPSRDELVVARLRAAGVVRVGKTNVPEFAAGSHTFNPVFGVTRNPYDLARSAGGSSGGAAAALASGMVALAEGSDMGGSLRNPASFCNVVGMRPTPGRVPSHPTLLGGATLGVQGPMARTVEDLALALSVLAGPDPRVQLSLHDLDPATLAAPLPTDLHGLRVAWAPDLGGRVPVEPAVRDVLAGVPDVVAGLGATVSDDCPRLDGADEVFDVLRAWQFAATHGDLVRTRPQDVKKAVRWNVDRGLALSGEDVGRAEALRTRLFERVVHFFDRYDVLLAPVAQVLPFDADAEYPTQVDGVPQESYVSWMRSCSIVSATGCPAASVPAGFSSGGLPVGLQVVAAPRADRRVLEVAHAFEQATGHGLRRPDLTAAPAR